MNWLERFLLPPHCQLCGATADADELCTTCASDIHLIDTACPLCALPNDDRSICAQCTNQPPNWQAAHSCFVYNGAVTQLMRRWKYGKERSAERLLCEAFAGWIEAIPLTTEATAIIAVPMHVHKLRKRGFNSAYQLAKTASCVLKLPLLEHALQRNHLSDSQAGLDKVARQQNLLGAFSLNTKGLKGHKHILLIDDVYTTGATASSCVKLLESAGITHRHLLTLARALPPKHNALPSTP